MMKTLFALLTIFFVCILPIYGETFFIVTDEKYEGTAVPLDEQVREGIFDGLFEAGHIVLDDCTVKLQTDILSEQSVAGLLRLSNECGMPFLVVVRVSSKKLDPSTAGERITTIATFAFFDVFIKKLLGSGEIKADNAEVKDKATSKAKLWFSVGEDIAAKVDTMYADYIKKTIK